MLAPGEKHLQCSGDVRAEAREGVNLQGICVEDVVSQPPRAAAGSVRVSKHGRNGQAADARCHMGYSSGLGEWFTAGIHWKGKALPANV